MLDLIFKEGAVILGRYTGEKEGTKSTFLKYDEEMEEGKYICLTRTHDGKIVDCFDEIKRLVYYVDVRQQAIVPETEISEFQAPETYYKYLCNNLDMYTESWFVGSEEQVLFSFNQIEVDHCLVNAARDEYFKKLGVQRQYLTSYAVPPQVYKEVLTDYGYIVKE